MVREVSGDSGAQWREPLKSKETPERPILPTSFDKESAREWLNQLREFAKWGIDNWDDEDVQGWVNEMLDYFIVNVHFTDDTYEDSTEILRQGLKIPYNSEKFEALKKFVTQMREFVEIDPDNIAEQKAALQNLVTTLNQII